MAGRRGLNYIPVDRKKTPLDFMTFFLHNDPYVKHKLRALFNIGGRGNTVSLAYNFFLCMNIPVLVFT